MIGAYKFNDLLEAGINVRRNNYSDDRSLAINKSALTNTTLYSNIRVYDNVMLSPFFGYADNTQVGLNDKGYIYGGNATVSEMVFNDLSFNSELNFVNEDINKRKNTDRLFSTSLSNVIENNLSNKLGGFYSEERKDFYFETDSVTQLQFNINSNIQSRVEQKYYISDVIQFKSNNSPLVFNLEATASWRDIDRNTKYKNKQEITSSSFDTKIEEFKLDFAGVFQYNSDYLGAIGRVMFSEQEEKHNAKFIEGASEITYNKRQESEAQKNNKAQLTTLSLAFNYNVSRNDFISLSLFHRKLSYNTQSEANFDDRDELLSIAGLNYSKNLSPFFNLFVNLEGSVNKIVYIFSERSSNNNIRRTLKLNSGGSYNGTLLSSRNEFEVSANYTVYEFEDLNPNFKSFAFRQFTYKDSSRINFNKNLSFAVNGYIKLSEQGDFVWSSFKGKPVRFLEEFYMEPKIEIKSGNATFSTGIRYFSLNTFKFDAKSNKIPDSQYKSIGPISGIKYRISGKTLISCSGWYEFITGNNKEKRELPNLFIDVKWNI